MLRCLPAPSSWAILALALLAGAIGVPAAGAGATQPAFREATTVCAFLGDRLRGLRDEDAFTLHGERGETVELTLAPRADPRNRGRLARLAIAHPGPRFFGRLRQRRVGALPLVVRAKLRRSGLQRIGVGQILSREPLPPFESFWIWAWLERLRRQRFEGEYCLTVRSTGDAATTLAQTASVEAQWVALAAGASERPPFERIDTGTWSGLLQPEIPLLGSRVYGLVLTSGIRASDGRPLEPDAAFRALAGTDGPGAGGPIARFDEDPEAVGNPYPEARLVRDDGTIHVPDRIALREIDPDDPDLELARTKLRNVADELEQLHGFGTTSAVRIALAGEVDVATVTPDHLLFFERTDGKLDLEGLLREAARHGVAREDVALAISFPSQRIEPDLREARERLLERAAADPDAFAAVLEDPNPADNLPIGIFGPGDPEFATYLAANPDVAAVIGGLVRAPDFRGDDEIFEPAKLAGDAPTEDTLLDFLLTLPAGAAPPYPVAIIQHGFAGANEIVLDVGPLLAAAGIAAIGIDAVDHGRRGIPISLIAGTPLEVRDVFRQTNVDQMSLLRAIEAGIDADGDGVPDLDADRVGYLGISFGGLVGGVLAGVEDRLVASVLNVTGGRIAFLGAAPGVSAIVDLLLSRPVGLDPASEGFQTYKRRLLELGELAENPADSLNFARRWEDRPFPGAPPRRILLQEGEGDDLVVNAFTEELAAVAGFATNTPASDPDGVSGHWIFAPPGGHGIFSREDVRAQARAFLAGDGTEIIEPTE